MGTSVISLTFGTPEPTNPLSSFSQDGVNVVLGGTYEVGQYVTDEYFVVADVNGDVVFSASSAIDSAITAMTATGTVASATSSTVTLTAAADGKVQVDSTIAITAGPGSPQTVVVTAWNAGTRVATISGWYNGTPNATSTYVVKNNEYWTGKVAIDPPDMRLQGWDNRTIGAGFGPGLIYSAGRAVSLPQTVNVTTTPKTVWFYRGKDEVQYGGSYTGTYAFVQVTVVPRAPQINPIKPSGFAGSKTQYTTADINYNYFTQRAIPVTAVEPTWSTVKSRHIRTVIQSGEFDTGKQIGVCNPLYTQNPYPAYQAIDTAKVLIGALSDSASRDTLINRIVRDGLSIYDQYKEAEASGALIWPAGGGFGYGYRPLMFLAGKFLGLSTLSGRPATLYSSYISQTVEQFGEDGLAFLGATSSEYPSGRPMYGVISSSAYPAGPFGNNHDQRDVNGIYEPHELPRLQGTAQAGGASTITLAAATPDIIANNYHIILTGGTGSGQIRTVSGWVNATKVVTVSSPWTTQPDATTTYDYCNGGEYQTLASKSLTGQAIALVMAGATAVSDYNNNTFFGYVRRWINEDGRLNPPLRYYNFYNYQTTAAASEVRRFGDSDDWIMDFYDSYAKANWPYNINQAGPVPSSLSVSAITSSGCTLSWMASRDNGTAYIVAQLASIGAPSATQVKNGQNGNGVAAEYAGSSSIVLAWQQTKDIIGLTSYSTAYNIYLVHTDSSGNNSSVTSVGFTTDVQDFSAVNFGGSAYLLRGAGLTGAADGNVFTFGTKIKPTAGSWRQIFSDNSDHVMFLLRASSNTLTIQIYDTSNAVIAQGDLASVVTAGAWHTILCKAYFGASPAVQLYIDGASQTPTWSTSPQANKTVDFTRTNWSIGATTGGANIYNGDMKFIWFDTSDVDLSVSGNRDNFLFANIGANGNGPTGSQPLVYATGNASAWNAGINLGSGGTFSMTGTVTNA